MLIDYASGQGSIVLRVKLLDSSVATGAGLTGLTNASSGLIISTIADNESTATAYTVAGSTVETITTLGTYAAPTATKCRFKVVDATNHPGVYELQIADARFAVSSAKSLLVSLSGATNLAQCDVVVPLRSVNPYDSVRMGMTALPNAAAGANGGLPLGDASGRVDLGKILGTASAGAVGYVGVDWAHINAPTTTVSLSGTTVKTVTNQLTAAQIATGVWQDTTAGDFTTASSVGKSIMNGVALGTGLTINAYTGNTPQTGDAYSLTAFVKSQTDQLTFSFGGAVDTNVVLAAGTSWNSGAITAASIAADAITAAKIADGAIDAATFAAGAIDAAAIATDAIGSNEISAAAVTKIQSGLALAATALSNATWTNARAGYLDNLNVGGAVASQADVQAVNQSASKHLLLQTVGQYERPESGTTVYTVECRTYSASTGAAVNADSTPTLTATGQTSGSLSGNLSAVSNPATGVYRATYTVSSTDTAEPVRFDVSATIASSTFTLSCFSQVVDLVSTTWTSTDATHLTAIYNKLPTNAIADETLVLAAVGSPMQAYTQPTGFLTAISPGTVASPTNITAGTITNATNVTNLTNAPTAGDFTAAMKAATLARVALVDVTTANTDMRGTDGAYTGTPPTAADNAAAVIAAGDVDGFTLEETLKLCLAVLAGKISGAGTTTITIRAADDSKVRVTATVDSNGNRTAVILDAAG